MTNDISNHRHFWHDLCVHILYMARRRSRDFEFATGVGQLIMFVVFVAIFVPPIRQTIVGVGMMFIGLIVLVVVLVAGIILISRSAKRVHETNGQDLNLPVSIPSAASITTEPQSVKTTADLIDQLRNIDWFQFEKVVALAYRKLGYTVTSRGGANPDGGIDLILEMEMTGQKTAVQCKQWKTWTVGVKPVREFLGALTASGIQKGIFVTLCGYTGDAKQFADENRIEIVNEVGLAKLLESTNALFDPDVLAILHDKQKCCPKCGAEMVLRTVRKGTNRGQQFWGCANFSTRRCHCTLPYQP